MKKQLTLFCSWIWSSLKSRNKLCLKSIWQNKVAFTHTHKKRGLNLTNYDIIWQSLHYTSIFPIKNKKNGTRVPTCKNMFYCSRNVAGEHPFVWSIQRMNCAENSLDSWTYPRSWNTTYCRQTDPLHNCTL